MFTFKASAASSNYDYLRSFNNYKAESMASAEVVDAVSNEVT